ncbi:Kinesin-like protein vab-8 [Dirofilaria immitis]|nr:Kinesin-like protein vab-8 [Dirofilaria immitis]
MLLLIPTLFSLLVNAAVAYLSVGSLGRKEMKLSFANEQKKRKLKTVLRLADEDLENVTVHGNSFVFRCNQSGISKLFSKYTFDQIFASDATIQQICSVCLPDLLQTCFSGSDACFIYFGAVTKAKNELLYSLYSRQNFTTIPSASTTSDLAGPSSGIPYPGIFPSALLLTFQLISELRQRRPDFHHSVRISALYYSQRRNLLIDLLASFILPVTTQYVTIREDSVLGIKIENHSELRVDSVEQAMLMIDDIVQARLTEDENEQRCGHLFFYINLYRPVQKNTSELIGGRSRLCLVDLGLGERTSKVIQSPLCMLLKESLGSVQVKASLLFASLSDRISESENILQMMSKIQRAAKPRKTHRAGSDSSSSGSTHRRLAANSEGNSSSEQSCAETVIFLGPSVRIEPTTEQQQAKRRTNGSTIDSTKRKMILDWIKDTQESEYSQPVKVSVYVQCNEDDIDMESLQQYSCRRQLDDILEDDEEASGYHSPRSLPTTEQFLESFENIGIQPLSILSLDKISASTSGKSASENEVEDDDLERAMAASISSIRSHEILSRLNDDLSEMQSEISSGNNGGYAQTNSFGVLKTVEKEDIPRVARYQALFNRPEILPKSKLPRRTAEVNLRKVSPEKQQVLLERTSLQYPSKNSRRDSFDSKKKLKEGHGSDENGSIYSRPLLTLLSPRSNRPRNRESFSASSGYESATGVDVVKNYGSLSKRRLLELSRIYSSNKHTLLMDKRVNLMIKRQNRLRDDLRDAKRLLGVADEHFLTASTSNLQGATLLEALAQETKILEKRLVACRNHAMIVTCLL